MDTEAYLKQRENIISCHGKVNTRSAAKLCNATRSYVHSVWHSKGLKPINKNKGKHGY